MSQLTFILDVHTRGETRSMVSHKLCKDELSQGYNCLQSAKGWGMACIRVRLQPGLIERIDVREFLQVIAEKTVALSAGVPEHTVASLELAPVGESSTIEILGVELSIEQRLRAEAGVSMVFARELDGIDAQVTVTYRVGDRSDWEEWSREFESEVEVIYGTVGPPA